MIHINAKPSYFVEQMIDYFYDGEYIGCTHWINGYFEKSTKLIDFINKMELW